jgi:hypothetical protein
VKLSVTTQSAAHHFASIRGLLRALRSLQLTLLRGIVVLVLAALVGVWRARVRIRNALAKLALATLAGGVVGFGVGFCALARPGVACVLQQEG